MLKIMAKCHCVLVPLKNLNMSSGQLVVLQAMALGKPVICTKTDGICDYVVNHNTGYLVDNNSHDWINALNDLNDKNVWSLISNNSLLAYQQQFTKKAMYKRIANLFVKFRFIVIFIIDNENTLIQ